VKIGKPVFANNWHTYCSASNMSSINLKVGENMRINTILITIFAITMLLVPGAKAAQAGTGLAAAALNTFRSVNFDSAGDSDNGSDSISVPEPGKPALIIASDAMLDPVSSSDKVAIGKDLDWHIKLAISYSAKSGQINVKNNLIKLLYKGTLEEKYAFVYSNGQKYQFPDRFVTRNTSQQICVSSHNEHVCNNKEVCKTVCAAGAVVCYAVTLPSGLPSQVCGPGAAVCNLVCAVVPDCSDVNVCDEWVDPPHQNGTDSNGNQE
jgi:hypothetical protein